MFATIGWKILPRTNTQISVKNRKLRTKKFYNIGPRGGLRAKISLSLTAMLTSGGGG